MFLFSDFSFTFYDDNFTIIIDLRHVHNVSLSELICVRNRSETKANDRRFWQSPQVRAAARSSLGINQVNEHMEKQARKEDRRLRREAEAAAAAKTKNHDDGDGDSAASGGKQSDSQKESEDGNPHQFRALPEAAQLSSSSSSVGTDRKQKPMLSHFEVETKDGRPRRDSVDSDASEFNRQRLQIEAKYGAQRHLAQVAPNFMSSTYTSRDSSPKARKPKKNKLVVSRDRTPAQEPPLPSLSREQDYALEEARRSWHPNTDEAHLDGFLSEVSKRPAINLDAWASSASRVHKSDRNRRYVLYFI